LLAMVVNDYAASLTIRGDFWFIASKLAPTVDIKRSNIRFQLRPSSRQIRNTCRRSSTNWSPGITPASFCKACRCAAER